MAPCQLSPISKQEEGGLKTGQKLLENMKTSGQVALCLPFQRCLPQADCFLRPDMVTQGAMHWVARTELSQAGNRRRVGQVVNPTAQLWCLASGLMVTG